MPPAAAPRKPDNGNPLLEVVVSIVIPAVILMKFSGEQHLGTLPALLIALRPELAAWFGADVVAGWRWLGAYRLPYALPASQPPGGARAVAPGVWLCGDHVAYPSLNGALASGRQAAEAVL